MQLAIVITTINVPIVIEQYIANFNKYGRKNVEFIIVGDLKTPLEVEAYIKRINSSDFPCIYLDVSEQERILRRVPEFAEFIPYNTVQRRNVGYLYAAERGADAIISIDDDNWPLDEFDFAGAHSIVGETMELDSEASSNGWYNSCSRLVSEPPRRFYHRGYPVSKRWQDENIQGGMQRGKVMVNIGLWLDDPDVDTITRMEEPFTVTSVKEPKRCFAVAPGTLLPFNSQNTAFHRDILPLMYLITLPSGCEPLRGNNNFRYDDIWMSFFAKLVIDHMGGLVVIGPPHVRQARNPHDYMLDLRKEILPMEMTNRLAELLPQIKLTETTYTGAYQELIEELRIKTAHGNLFDIEERRLIKDMLRGMRLWLEALNSISGNMKS